MFKSVLAMVEEKVPSYENRKSFTDEEWLEFAEKCLCHIMVFDDFIPTFELVLGKGLVAGSTQDLYYHRKDYAGISFCRIRPENDYYSRNGTRIPSPADPTGPSATGLAIEVGLYGGYRGKNFRPASVDFSFEVWGRRERQAFKKLFTDYRRIMHLLLSGLGLEFQTACVFDSLNSYRKHDVAGKLETYLAEEDDESTFSLVKTYYGDADEKEFAKVFMVFLILYSSCLNRLVKRGNKDILLDYYRGDFEFGSVCPRRVGGLERVDHSGEYHEFVAAEDAFTYADVLAQEEQLIDGLQELAEVDGHDMGAGEVNFFIVTSDVATMFEKAKTLIIPDKAKACFKVAYRVMEEDDFHVLYPPGLESFEVA